MKTHSNCPLVTARATSDQKWQMQPVSIPTAWASLVNPDNAWPEYPRPQMVRGGWWNLNGLWNYAITARQDTEPDTYDGRILVPYPLESALSGVAKRLTFEQLLWYRRTFSVERAQMGKRTVLHFGAVDFEATVFVNGRECGSHRGGYQGFSFDITDELQDGENELVVRVWDPTDHGPNPYGKQRSKPVWAFYTPSSGIWQTVWLEQVPSTYIETLKMTPDVDRGELLLEVQLKGTQPGLCLEAIAKSGSQVVARQTLEGKTTLKIREPRLWSPDDPHLYDLEVRLLKDGNAIDAVASYFGLRKIEVKPDEEGKARICLNGRYTFNLGVVDQGFWPDGLYTAATDEALQFDLKAIKALGFNTVRKHIKVEPQRWYYHCDRIGLMVWQDMPSGNNDSPEARAQFEREIAENLEQLHNHPSITTWVPFNEGWGTYDQDRIVQWVKAADPSRLLNGHSGPYDQLVQAQMFKHLQPSRLPGPLCTGTHAEIHADYQATQYGARWTPGDIVDLHYYAGPRMLPTEGAVASVTGEHGSFGVYIEGHVLDDCQEVGKGIGGSRMSPSQFLEAYASSIETQKALEARGLAGSLYFELTDVETEQQGFLTYDRALAKVPLEAIARLNERLVPQAKNYATATAELAVPIADRTPEPERYAKGVAQYQAGRRGVLFLKRLALMALRQGDLAQATEAGNAFISRSPEPYTEEFWRAVVAITCSTNDKGFELLSRRIDEVAALLGPHAAEKKIVEIITREVTERQFEDKARAPGWATLEASLVAQHGVLGREAVCGIRMMVELVRKNWVGFGQSYARYFASAVGRSLYRWHTVTYHLFKHVNDRPVLEAAARAMERLIEAEHEFKFGRYDPSELDTYANVLYKLGRRAEALQWQKKALELSDGRDFEIAEHLERMKRGMPTWEVSQANRDRDTS
jgi:tetratricopeptide (TPR) repeat protein